MANLFEPDFDEQSEQPGFIWRRAKLAHQAESERLGASLFELAPGEAICPLHYHLANEELLIVIEGTPSLRTVDGERELTRGEVAAFQRGETGGHQVINRSEATARVLMVSEMNSPELVIRPESGKLSAMGRPPGSRDGGIHWVFHERDEAPFWEGEEPPPAARQ